ncbi:MAG TPA: hypothetical protein DCQ26_02675 [Marinilabiliales bacterium]|nr:MAG: hypothetical protein A2W95_18615 [Bacteroidetes bacterium GWA2_40_14]OFX62237.1 MAG: hypothetical protein A2W84_12255 [Bacteroidetes bacterium GWC2_40_13]OFX73793.1 MAG: hypothetical protein A2W96_07950 [Bacteroidetes bacterium GWD2_40_43]OFX89421.1 MAG: hypothetical protein A2W97_13770 [Bacteroidetes bacterium GWE2_40_63]OFY23247.1 MAG: hypothetical protein A2W88_19430 [Bacteroidetes bacterium GWF2_40_13]OFZ28144.1 MAG: hypothetical protein A2437_04565 [Bacteroidetes bacterium RIFOXYC
MRKINTLKLAEIASIVVIWIIIFSFPTFIIKENDTVSWSGVFRYWERVYPYFVIFVVNHFVLIPFLLFKNRQILYIFSALMLIASISVAYLNTLAFEDKPWNREPDFKERPWENNPDSEKKQLQSDDKFKPTDTEMHKPEKEPRNRDDREPFEPGPPKPLSFPRYLNLALISLLMVGFDTGIRVAFKWSESEQEKNKLENENIKNQLAFLKHQVSPHFFMNTLNNIHSLIDINSEEAKEAIIKLSKMMRYLLYDSNENLVPISKEMEFNQSYINLMKLRFSDKVKIEVKIPQEIPPLRVHPMLFISLLENAFKHGISYKNESFIHIEWVFTPSSILFEISNSKHPNNVKEEASGIGVENTRKRLELLYSNRYRMNIEETDTVYTVSLTLFT